MKTDKIKFLIAEARKSGLTDCDLRCINDAHRILSEDEIIYALEKFISRKSEKSVSPYIKI